MKYGLYYNKEKIGDVLIIIFKSNEIANFIKTTENCRVLYRNNELVGINILNISKILKIKSHGFLPLINKEVLDVINSILLNNGLEALPYQNESGFVVAKIIDMEEHPESDHLHICKVDCGNNNILQIVCGAYNAKVGMKVVCALPYAFMPNGQQIIPSKLLGIESNGMLCSGRELNLSGYDNVRGLLELDETYKIGNDFWGE